MIPALLLLAAQPAAAASVQPAPAENDIVVIGRRIRKVRFTLRTDKAGRAVCRIKRSSGDSDIDSLACDAARACMASTTPEAMVACLTPKFDRMPEQVAARRRARAESGGHAPN